MHGDRAVDLHTHSTASDGRLSPSALVQLAASVGLNAIGLTDHDTTAGLPEAEAEAHRLGLIVVPGVELSASHDRREAHMLGYFIDREREHFQKSLATFVRQRSERIDRMIERLDQIGIRVDRDAVMEKAGEGTVGRPHLAWTLIEMGVVSDIAAAFDQYLGTGRPGYVPRPYLAPEEAIRLIRSAGGAPVLAHPYSTGDPAGLAARLKPLGLAGMEVWYGEYNDEQRQALHRIALANDLIPTGGSDFHAQDFKPGRDLGQPPVPWETIDRLYHDAADWDRP
jgi:predicted metal-dependent phosphoesterase TrpH